MESDDRRIYVVGFAVRNSLLLSVEPPSQETERILSLRLTTSSGPTLILNVYAPTHCSTAKDKYAFYKALETRIREIPDKENLILLGDFNARLGTDHTSWPHFGVCRLNDNGQRLLELCSFYDLAITNNFYPTKSHHRILGTSQVEALAPPRPRHH
jgi:exonuclease III